CSAPSRTTFTRNRALGRFSTTVPSTSIPVSFSVCGFCCGLLRIPLHSIRYAPLTSPHSFSPGCAKCHGLRDVPSRRCPILLLSSPLLSPLSFSYGPLSAG